MTLTIIYQVSNINIWCNDVYTNWVSWALANKSGMSSLTDSCAPHEQEIEPHETVVSLIYLRCYVAKPSNAQMNFAYMYTTISLGSIYHLSGAQW